MTRGCPNGGTPTAKNRGAHAESNRYVRGTRGTETSKYPEEEKSKEIPQVVASERGGGQTAYSDVCGVGTVITYSQVNRSAWEGAPEGVRAT